MCIIHKGFRGFRAVSPASTLGGNLIGLKPAIPYEIIHSPLSGILKQIDEENIFFNNSLRHFGRVQKWLQPK